MAKKTQRRRKTRCRETSIPKLVASMIRERGGNATDFARDAGLTLPQLSRITSPARYEPPPGVLTCLKLSRASGVAAALVLRTAGHPDFAVLIEQLLGRAEHPPDYTTVEQAIIRALRNMRMHERVSFTNLILLVGSTEARESVEGSSSLFAPFANTGG
jgi:hypothetical protein